MKDGPADGPERFTPKATASVHTPPAHPHQEEALVSLVVNLNVLHSPLSPPQTCPTLLLLIRTSLF